MPTFLKLREAGESHVMHVVSCKKATTGKYPGYIFLGDDGVAVEVPEAATERQLKRMNATPHTIEGCYVTISRDPNANDATRPFWGVSLVGDLGAEGDENAQEGTEEPVETGGPPPTAPRPPKLAGGPVAAALKKPAKTAEELADEKAIKLAALEAEYLSLMQRVADSMRDICAEQRDQKGILQHAPLSLDASAVQAATFSIWKQQAERGLR